MIDDLLELQRLKDLRRAGWVRAGVPEPEDVAAHSWGVALLVAIYLPADLDRGRALGFAILHDLAEVRTGDWTPHDGIEAATKARREAEVMASLCAARPGIHDEWAAYERQDSPEARFVRQCDRVDMALRAAAYHRDGRPGMAEFVASAARFVTDPNLSEIVAGCGAVVACRGSVNDP